MLGQVVESAGMVEQVAAFAAAVSATLKVAAELVALVALESIEAFESVELVVVALESAVVVAGQEAAEVGLLAERGSTVAVESLGLAVAVHVVQVVGIAE